MAGLQETPHDPEGELKNFVLTEGGSRNNPFESKQRTVFFLPKIKFVQCPVSNLRKKFPHEALSELGLELLKSFLTYDPRKRVTCDSALDHVSIFPLQWNFYHLKNFTFTLRTTFSRSRLPSTLRCFPPGRQSRSRPPARHRSRRSRRLSLPQVHYLKHGRWNS